MTDRQRRPGTAETVNRSAEAYADHGNTTDVEAEAVLTELPLFEWRPCPVHSFLGVSIIVTADSSPWCVGDGTGPGHWPEVPT